MEKQQKEFTDGWDPLFIGYSAAVYFHRYKTKINSWTTQAKKMIGSMPPKFGVRNILRKLDQADLENKLPVWEDGRMIMEEGHIALKDEMKFATRKYRAAYGLKQLEMKQEERDLDAAGPLFVALSEYKKPDPGTPSPLSVGTPGVRRSNPVEDRFKYALERGQAESEEGESMDETLSDAGEEMEVGNTPDQARAESDFTTHELLQDLSGDDWANMATPPLGSPRKNLELPLTSVTSNMGMILLSAIESKKNAFEGNKWREFLSEFNQKAKTEATLESFKE